MHVHLEKGMFWKVLSHIFVPSSGLDENNIKGAFYPGALLAQLYPNIGLGCPQNVSVKFQPKIDHLL